MNPPNLRRSYHFISTWIYNLHKKFLVYQCLLSVTTTSNGFHDIFDDIAWIEFHVSYATKWQ